MQSMQTRFIRFIAISFVVVASLTPVKSRAQGRAAGWVGVVITTGIGTANSAGAMVFNDYPVIESIDPGSPAERAGLQSGDIIISLNSQDLRKNPIPMQSLLVPGQKIVFRYKRHDEMRTLSLTVAERPVGTSGHTVISMIGPAPDASTMRGNRDVELSRAGALLPAITLAPVIRGPGSPTIVIAGAELTQLNDGLRQALKVTGQGIFVINVALGTPAGESGLKSGDVIRKVNRQTIDSPGELVRLMNFANVPRLRLEVLRNRKEHSLTLAW
jgi:S1-C subfamily serine protease